ncbi:MAG: hypothetical protein AB7O48_05615 [Cyclobacteriaceae bacterium]
MKFFRIGILFALIGILVSCSKDEDPDFVGESVGSYSYSVRIFDANNTVADVVTGNLTLSRNGDDLTIIIDDIESMKSSRLELASNGYGFDIEAATLTDNDGDLVDRKGNTSATIGGKSYHGRYDAGAKQLFINASYTYQDSKYASYNFSAEVTATKK